MHLSPCRRERLGTVIRASKSKNLVSRVDQLPDNRGSTNPVTPV